MTDAIRFHFDPLCPWSYQTSRWARRLEELGEVSIDWGVFSLAIANNSEKGRAASERGSAPALRIAILVRAESGASAVGRFYATLGAEVHEAGADVDDRATLQRALRAAGLDAGVLDRALADPQTWAAVQAEHDEVVASHKAFGVPTIILDGGAGLGIFGPVVSEVPSDEEAVELWRHVSWLARYPNFAELKREQRLAPSLESVRRWEARSRADAAA
jgi:predicted DsbA family dithiol-disulfide isomerase